MQDRFQSVLKEHAARYPAMTPQDYGKLAYQNVFGPEHLVQDTWQVGQRLREEWMTLPPSASGGPWAEPIGNGLCRLHLAGPWDPEAAALTAELFCRTAREHSGTPKELAERLDVLRDQPVPGMEEWLASYEAQGCPAVHHSEAFRAAYQPHYRVLAADYAHYFPALLAIRRLLAGKRDEPWWLWTDAAAAAKAALASCWGGCLTAMSSIWTIFTCPLPTARKTGQRSPAAIWTSPVFAKRCCCPPGGERRFSIVPLTAEARLFGKHSPCPAVR